MLFVPGLKSGNEDRDAMRSYRRQYYNLFSYFYDFIIRLHSQDKAGYLRRFIVDKAKLVEGGRVLDICTGTGSVAIELSRQAGNDGMSVGVDFSRGMLDKARNKVEKLGIKNVHFVEANVSELPFKTDSFHATTCSHAFYELKGAERGKTIKEVARVNKKGGRFCMMEHEVPENPFVKMLFYLRMYFMGSTDAKIFLKEDTLPFKEEFRKVKKEITTTGKSKLIWAEK